MATQENFDRLYNMFRTRFRNQPRQVQEAMLEEARLARLAEAERRNIPREFANANIGTLAACLHRPPPTFNHIFHLVC